jgi:hypothetical protein
MMHIRGKAIKLVVIRNVISLVVLIPLTYYMWWVPFQEVETTRQFFELQGRYILTLLLFSGALSLIFLPFIAKATGVNIWHILRKPAEVVETRPDPSVDPFLIDKEKRNG